MSIPSTPRHSRQSTMDYSNMSNPPSPQDQRRLSKASSYNEPMTPTHQHHPSFGQGDGIDVFSSGGYGGGMGGMGSLGGLGGGDDSGIGGSGGGGGGGGMGLGNLADELADALSDSDEDEEREDEGEDGDADADADHQQDQGEDSPRANDSRLQDARDSGVDVASTGSPQKAAAAGTDGSGHARNSSLSLPTANSGSSGTGGRQGGRSGGGGHKRMGSAYDGSEYGTDSDLDLPGMPPSLLVKIDAVELLARRGTEDIGGPAEGVCKRLTEALRDLGSQSGVEGGASRLITAHSALTTHLAHQTRQLHALAFPLYSPLAGFGTAGAASAAAAAAAARMPGLALTRNGRGRGRGAHKGNHQDTDDSDSGDGDDDDNNSSDDDDEDDLQSMLTALVDQMPRPTTAAYQSLAALHALTSDLVATLTYLSDTLHMTRQTTTTATRRLRSAKELVAEMRRDDEVREQGERWLARGDWDARLRRRECAHVCGEVVGGFEEVCNGWRARLLAQAEAAAAAATAATTTTAAPGQAAT